LAKTGKNDYDFVEIEKQLATVFSTKKINIDTNNVEKFVKWKEK
jgi:hypothetical protein